MVCNSICGLAVIFIAILREWCDQLLTLVCEDRLNMFIGLDCCFHGTILFSSAEALCPRPDPSLMHVKWFYPTSFSDTGCLLLQNNDDVICFCSVMSYFSVATAECFTTLFKREHQQNTTWTCQTLPMSFFKMWVRATCHMLLWSVTTP